MPSIFFLRLLSALIYPAYSHGILPWFLIFKREQLSVHNSALYWHKVPNFGRLLTYPGHTYSIFWLCVDVKTETRQDDANDKSIEEEDHNRSGIPTSVCVVLGISGLFCHPWRPLRHLQPLSGVQPPTLRHPVWQAVPPEDWPSVQFLQVNNLNSGYAVLCT